MYILYIYIYVRYDSHKFGGSVTASSKLETPIWGLFSASMESRLRFDHPVLITGPPERWLVAAYKESMCQRPLQTSRRFASLLAINMKGTVLAGGFLGFQIYGTLNVESDGKCRKRIIHILDNWILGIPVDFSSAFLENLMLWGAIRVHPTATKVRHFIVPCLHWILKWLVDMDVS